MKQKNDDDNENDTTQLKEIVRFSLQNNIATHRDENPCKQFASLWWVVGWLLCDCGKWFYPQEKWEAHQQIFLKEFFARNSSEKLKWWWSEIVFFKKMKNSKNASIKKFSPPYSSLTYIGAFFHISWLSTSSWPWYKKAPQNAWLWRTPQLLTHVHRPSKRRKQLFVCAVDLKFCFNNERKGEEKKEKKLLVIFPFFLKWCTRQAKAVIFLVFAGWNGTT